MQIRVEGAPAPAADSRSNFGVSYLKATGWDLRMQRKPQPNLYPLSLAYRMTHTLRIGNYLDRSNSNKTTTVFVE